MTKRQSRLIALLMIIFAIGFICYALGHPERAWPWPNWITNIIYFIYPQILITPEMMAHNKKNGLSVRINRFLLIKFR